MRARLAVVVGLVVLLLGACPAVAQDAPRLSSLAAAARDVAPGTRACFSGSKPGDTRLRPCHYGRRGPRLLLIGDSHLRALSPAFRRLAEEGMVRVTLLIRSRCGWSSREIESPKRWVRDDCQAWRANVARYVARQRGVAAVVVNHRASTMPGTRAQRGPDTVRAWRPALRRRIPVIAVSDSANWVLTRPSPLECLRDNREPRQWRNCADRTANVMWFDWTAPSVSLARERYGARAAHRISMRSTYCPSGLCRVVTPHGQVMFRDRQHLTATYTRSLAPFFERRLRRIGVLPS
ncbi:SGNH hydrolase domain-containing protein [Aeromicrobium sp. 179-A 4D2 NHS]|uniref:SGNH hydrolase domain-containing protein n=1 Tax=Aeromicrobium sp. 179-A 4D2 NHS TaxID=3142375 RepID=UPI00399FCEAA